MKVSRIDKNGDWTFGSGKANYISRSNAVGQNVVTRIRSFTNDWYLNTNYGIDWINLLGTKGVTIEQIKRSVRAIIVSTEGVLRIDELSTKLDRVNRKVTINATITTIFNDRIAIPEVQI